MCPFLSIQEWFDVAAPLPPWKVMRRRTVPDTSSDVLGKPPMHINISANEPPTEDQAGHLARDEAHLDAHCT